METTVCLKYLVNDCGCFTGWASFQYGLRDSATCIPFYSSRMNIKIQQTPKKESILSKGNFLIKKSKYTLWWNESTENTWLKNEITAKTGFCSLIFHMLASYIGPKVSNGFCDILTWQITRKLITIKSFFKDASVILLNKVSSKGTFSKLSTTNYSYKFWNISNRIF